MSTPTRGLTEQQLDLLLRSISPNRIQEHKGQSHLEAWDVRRWLTRIFGFGGWSDEILACELVHQAIWPVTDSRTGEPVPGKHRATVVYRVTLRLVVKDVHGNVLNAWDDVATGEAVNQPTVGDAHDLAIKAAVSQALKRCAVNLGDQFGLSLYNDGSVEPVIVATFGHPNVERQSEAQPVPEDAPVVGGELVEQDRADAEKGYTLASTPTSEQQTPEQTAPEPVQPDTSFWDTDEGRKLLKVLHTLIFRKYGPKTDEERHAAFSKFTGRPVTSAKQLTRDEADRFIAALRTQPDYAKPKPAPKQAADGNENFKQAEALLKLQQGQEAQQLEDDLRDEVESAANPNDLAAAMSMAVALRDAGRLSKEQYARLAAAADERAARARKQYAAVAR